MPVSRLLETHLRQILKLEDAAVRKLFAVYRDAEVELAARLARIDGAGAGGSFTAQQLALIRAQVDDALRVMWRAQGRELGAAFREALNRGTEQGHAEVIDLERRFGNPQRIEDIGLIPPAIPADQVAFLAEPQNLLLSRFRDGVATSINRSLATSVLMGEGTAAAARRLAGAMQGERYQLERIVRTEINQAANHGHLHTIQAVASEFPEMGLKKQWSAHLDGRTSTRCRGLHLQVREVKEQFEARDGWRGLMPPSHPNCRSRVMPYSERWEARSVKKIAGEAPGAPSNPERDSRPTPGQRRQAQRSNAERGVHLIDEADVSAWLEGSAVPHPVMHRASPHAAEEIRRQGVRFQADPRVQFGDGFYTSLHPLPEYGPAEVRVAIRTTNPLVVRNQHELLTAVLAQNRAARSPAEIRQALLDAGYDGLIVRRPDGNDFVVGIQEGTVRIIK